MRSVYGHIEIDGRGVQCNIGSCEGDFSEHFPPCDVAGPIPFNVAREAVLELTNRQISEWVTDKALDVLGIERPEC